MHHLYRKSLLLVISVLFFFSLTGCTKSDNATKDGFNKKPIIAVSIVPEATFVKEVAGDLVDTVILIPPGNSVENYAPTPNIMRKFSDADLYFSIGVPTEDSNIMPKIKDINNKVKIIDLSKEVSKVYKDREFAPGERDHHIWLSPKRAKIMVTTISNELSSLDEKNAEVYKSNAESYIKKLDELDTKIKDSLENLQNKTFIVYHPSYGYFADDYSLTMLSLEKEGKEATAKDMQELIDLAKKQNIKVIFYQAEIDSKQSRAFAESIKGETEQISPLAPDYINNLEKMADTFNKVLK